MLPLVLSLGSGPRSRGYTKGFQVNPIPNLTGGTFGLLLVLQVLLVDGLGGACLHLLLLLVRSVLGDVFCEASPKK